MINFSVNQIAVLALMARHVHQLTTIHFAFFRSSFVRVSCYPFHYRLSTQMDTCDVLLFRTLDSLDLLLSISTR
jgi:hypothetical protein